ncbi:hypothetical protein HPB52_001935 [Rhipicephalus sanguineus]|uniref:Vitamin K-dependent protein C n=1 Tax=Rhipicephalus sanguineus TaxID=34632 RepID=A0A9D4PR05_RHISA|nr:hypothetical protein HPB52_001935 [Rhipicephalus sanguineus]
MRSTENSRGCREAGDYSIDAGVHKLSLDNAQKQVRQGLKRFAHKGFRLWTFRNDIGLLKLDSPVDIAGSEGYIGTVCLPPKGFKIKDDIVIAGWGTTREGGYTSDVLQAVSVPTVGDGTCYYRYFSFWSLFFGGNIHYDSMFCAGERRGGKDSCQGDSGGPAVQYVDGQAVLVGIVSWGEGCARAGKPGVYTEVAYFLDWIREQMASSPDEEEKKPSTSAPTRTSENAGTRTSENAQTRTSENAETRITSENAETSDITPSEIAIVLHENSTDYMWSETEFISPDGGDSGGPLQCTFDNRVWFLAGVISRGDCYRTHELPLLLTSASAIEQWIHDVTGGLHETGDFHESIPPWGAGPDVYSQIKAP